MAHAESALVMNFLVLILFVQVLLESLPVSSSGHLVLLSKLLFFLNGTEIFNFECITSFYYFLHGATVFVVLVFFYPYWKALLYKMWKQKKLFTREVIFFLIIEMVTFFGYILVQPFLKKISLSLGFLITAVTLFSLKFLRSAKKCEWQFFDAILIGLAQTLAFVPGVSRLGLTYFSARVRNIRPHDALAISFIASVPLGIAGFVIGLYKLWISALYCFDFYYLIYIIIASLGAYFLLFLLYCLIKRGRLWWLGWYMLLPMVVSFFL